MIQKRECHAYRSGSCPSGCGHDSCCVKCDPWEDCEQCGSWQKAKRDDCPDVTKIGKTKPWCVCSGCFPSNEDCQESCVAAPTDLRYYNNPNYPLDPCSSAGAVDSENIKLPVKLDWADVEGWKDGWCGGGGYQITDNCGSMTTVSSSPTTPWRQCANRKSEECIESAIAAIPQEDWDAMNYCQKRSRMSGIKSSCAYQQYITECVKNPDPDPDPSPDPDPDPNDECDTGECPYPDLVYELSELVQYYEITITGEIRDKDGGAMGSFTAELDQSEFIPPHPCFFKSNREYKWKVRACCGNGDCGPWSEEKTFTTNLAPEPVWPHDPDWAGPDRAEPYWQPPTEENQYPVHLEWCPVEEAKSYYLRAYEYKKGKEICPPPNTSHLACPKMIIIPIDEEPEPRSWVNFNLDVFTKETDYEWEVATCLSLDEKAKDCKNFSQMWRFFGTTELAKVELISPKDKDCANLYSQLRWGHSSGARSYVYKINQINPLLSVLPNGLANDMVVSLKDIWDGNLKIDTDYTWQVKACWDEKGKDCQEKSLSEEWSFTTTGAIPTGLDVMEKEPDTGHALIPIKLKWDNIPCAASYKYKLTEEGGNVIAEGMLAGTGVGAPAPSELSINYDFGNLKQGTPYSWTVWTCADVSGDICGASESGSFITFELKAPQNPHPEDPDGKFYTHEYYLKWDSVLGGAFYQYEIDGKIAPTIIGGNNVFIDTSKLELGTYTWRVKACLDANCDEFGPESTWTFTLVEGEAPGAGGLVPCGRYVDNPDTPWNERDACGLEHVFIMIYLIIEFMLWKLIPIALVLLALASGVIFYFSGQLGISEPTAQVKSLWKAAGIGSAVVFLAWTGISLLLGLLGYQVGIFGHWWILNF